MWVTVTASSIRGQATSRRDLCPLRKPGGRNKSALSWQSPGGYDGPINPGWMPSALTLLFEAGKPSGATYTNSDSGQLA